MLRRLRFLLVLLVLLAGVLISATPLSVAPTRAQGEPVPPEVAAAVNALNGYLSQPIIPEQVENYSVTAGTYTDTALGCSLLVGTPLANPVNAYRVQLTFQGVIYEFEVSQDGMMIIPCTPILLGGQVVIPVNAAPVQTIGNTGCPVDYAGYLPPRLEVGGFARIGAEGEPNRIREAPSVDAEQLGLINPGTTVEVLDGPVCEATSRIIWWLVRDGTLEGYTAEGQDQDYFLEPVDRSSIPDLPAAREPITALNASQVVALSTVTFEGGAAVDFGGVNQLLVAGTEGITYYDLAQRTIQLLPLAPDTTVFHVEYSPDGRYIAYSTDSSRLFVYDIPANDTDEIEFEEGTFINDIDFNLNNVLAVAYGDPLGGTESINGWTLYDIENLRLIATFPTDSWVGDVEFGAAGLRLAWLSDTVNVGLLPPDFQDEPPGDLPVISGAIGQPTRTGLAWQPVEDINDPDAIYRIAYGDGNVIMVFDIVTSALLSFTNEEDYLPGTLAFNTDGSVLAALNRTVDGEPMPHTLKLFDVISGVDSAPLFSEVFETAQGMSFSPDGTLIVVLTDTELRFYGIPV